MLPPLPTILSVLLGLLAVAVVLHGLAVWATFRRTRRRAGATAANDLAQAGVELPGISLLKPLKGSEDALEQNLRSFFDQAYAGPLELLFCATDAADAGLALARRLADEYPQVRARFVVSREDFGENPKVSNMQGGLQLATEPYVLQSDANVRLAPGYLEALMRHTLAENADMVGSLIVGDGERSLGAALENLQMTAFIAPAVCIAKEVANVPCIIGKSMLMRREALQAVGGLGAVRDVLAEDFMLAQAFQQAGYRVSLSPLTVANINQHTTLREFMARHARWLKMRAVINVPAHLADPLANPTLFSLLCALVTGAAVPFMALHMAVLVYKTALDRALLLRLRGHAPGLLVSLPRTQLRDLLLTGIWAYACFSRTTVWRGRRLRLGRGSRLCPVDGGPIDSAVAPSRRVG